MTTIASNPHTTAMDAAHAWHFDHVNVSMGDGRALGQLFEGVMGLRPGYRPPFPFAGTWLYADGQPVVHAVNDPALSGDPGAVRFGHIAFRSDQPAAPLMARLHSSGLPFRVARVPQDKTIQIFVLLPGNFVVELDLPDDSSLPTDHTYGVDQAAPGSQDF